jgi:carbamoyltransferase
MSKSVILGISAFYHDAAAALLVDGRLVAAAQEERFSRKKHDPDIPLRAIGYCLDRAGIAIDQVECVAYYEDPYKKLGRNIWLGLPDLPMSTPRAMYRLNPFLPEQSIRERLGFEKEIRCYDHHLSHASSAYHYSGFDSSAVLVADGVGEWQTLSLYEASGTKIELLGAVDFPHSIGLLYSAITAYLGFEVNDGEYKVMGLAPYGRETYVSHIRRLITRSRGGEFELDMSYFAFLREERMYSEKLVELLGRPPREKEAALEDFHRDIAKSLQVVLEELLIEKAVYLHELCPRENLCLAGGVALNCVANARIRRDGPFENLFVQPASSDAGGALGAAALAYVDLHGRRLRDMPLGHVFLGPSFTDREIRALFSSWSVSCENYGSDSDALVAATARRLADGQIVGWLQGAMEFGPRALGNRSILADPRRPDMRDRINASVKMREAFRPFAPAVMWEKVGDHFDIDHESPYMLETCRVISELDLPAITHVDGSARIQTVRRAQNPRFHSLIEAFDALTGCPIILNTSFNMRGEPIVCTPLEALLCFIRSDLDCLVLGSLLLDKKSVPKRWLEWFENTYPERIEGVSNTVYTFL